MSQCIQVNQLTRDYGKFRALDSVSFSVQKGEIFGFLGPNGAGKSTTIKILTTQLRPTSGTASILGFDIVHERQHIKPEIGVVFEIQNLYERLSARRNLDFSARLYRVPRSHVDRLLEMLGLTERANDSVMDFSNGMKQRLLIARALLHNPQVIFLDEPTRGLDPHAARDIRKIIRGLSDKGITIFLTTHYMEEADQLCQRIAFLNNGKIAALDTPGNLKRQYGRDEKSTLEDIFIKLTGSSLT